MGTCERDGLYPGGILGAYRAHPYPAIWVAQVRLIIRPYVSLWVAGRWLVERIQS
jgi:hypothetical protein